MFERHWLKADWPAPSNVYAATTLRSGGVSSPPYESWNMGLHTGDSQRQVQQNRDLLALPNEPFWLEQVHSNLVVEADQTVNVPLKADGSYTQTTETVCAVMTADCLPLLLCDAAGQQVAAIHVGWRGLAAGIIENAVQQFSAEPEAILVWFGPAIGNNAYEIGAEVHQVLTEDDVNTRMCFKPSREGHWWMDIYALAKLRLFNIGIDHVYGGDACTYREPDKYFSYRRDGKTGRMVSVIWMGKQ